MSRKLQRGLYVIFEGGDGTSKTTSMRLVAEKLRSIVSTIFPDTVIRETHHPGSTPLGRHLRQLVKYPETIGSDIVIDDLSRQMLYMVDTVAFIQAILVPALNANEIVFADRSSFISALVYGTADGLQVDEIVRLFGVITPPRADRVFILSCPWEVGRQRVLAGRRDLDHYDRKDDSYYEKIQNTYDNLVTNRADMTIAISTCVAIDDIQFVDTNTQQQIVVDTMVADLVRLLEEREGVSFSKK